MKISPFDTEVNLLVPSTSTEYDQLAKKDGACLSAALKYALYHIYFSDVRDVVLHGQDEIKDETGTIVQHKIVGLDELYSLERRTKPVIGKDGKPKTTKVNGTEVPVTVPDEKEEDFFKRVVAHAKLTPEQVTSHIQSVVDALPLDLSERTRIAKTPTLAKCWKEAAAKFLTVVESKPENIGIFNQRAHKLLGEGKQFVPAKDVPITDPQNVESLGWLIKAFSEETAKQAMTKIPGLA